MSKKPKSWADEFKMLMEAAGLNRVQTAKILHLSPLAVTKWASGESAPTWVAKVGVRHILNQCCLERIEKVKKITDGYTLSDYTIRD